MMATRRAFLAHSGAIVIGFALLGGKAGRALAETSGHVASHADAADQAIRLVQTTTDCDAARFVALDRPERGCDDLQR